MLKERTENSTFNSPSIGDFVTAAQYITEILVTRQAHKENKSLKYKFWEDEPWRSLFVRRITEVNRVLKQYNVIPVVRAITKLKWCYGLNAPAMKTEIALQQKIYEQEEKNRESVKIEVTDTTSVPTIIKTNKSLVDRLK